MTFKNYTQSALDTEELINLIQSKNIIIEDRSKVAFHLQTVSYHRLFPYLESFLRNHKDYGQPNFDKIWELYCFDRELRLLINDAIERIEVTFRTALSETMSCLYTPHWFLDKRIFKDMKRYNGFIEQIKMACNDKHNSVIQEYYRYYDYPKYPPSWILFEYLSFGACISAFSNIKHLKDRKAICNIFKEHPTTMQSWLYAIRYIRNLCAHHARVWNRWFVVTPALSFLLGETFDKQNTCYAQLIILDRLLQKISPNSAWKMRLKSLLQQNNMFPIYEIGFIKDWEKDVFWL